jgi:hypothetical protein
LRRSRRYRRPIALYKTTLDLEAKLGPDEGDMLWTRGGLAAAYELLVCWAEAETLVRDTMAIRRKTVSPDSPYLAGDLVQLGRDLMNRGRWSEAEPLVREAVTILEKATPDDWRRSDAMSLLGGSALGQGRHAEADRAVVDGYEGMKVRAPRIPLQRRSRLLEAAMRVARLYDGWNNPDEAATWTANLGLSDLPAEAFAPQ